MPRRITFHELSCKDVNEWAAYDLGRLLRQLSSEAPLPTQAWLRYMLDSGTRIFIAMESGKLVGVTLLCQMVGLVGQKDWIEDVVVDLEYRGEGIATKLLEMAKTASRNGPAKSLNLTSNPKRTAARRLYEKLGYYLRDTGVFRLEHPAMDTVPAASEK